MADALAAVQSLAELEHAVAAELESWPDLDLAWCTVSPLMPGRDDARTPQGQDLPRILTRLRSGDHQPVTVVLRVGEAVAAPCGGRSGLVLVVADRSGIRPGVEDAVAELAGLVGLTGRTLDITAELDQRRLSTRFEELVRFSSDAIFIVDTRSTIRYVAPSVTAVLGYPSVDLDGVPFADLVHPAHHADLRTYLGAVALQDPRSASSVEMRFVQADGSAMHGEITGANLLGNPDVRGVVLTVRDVSARKDLEEQLRHQAFHDSLTGLANRALFTDRLDRAMRVRRLPSELSPAVAFLDLDDFKQINDSLGHAVGDAVLRSVAERIERCLRASDTAARLGGDEFALLIEDVPSESALHDLVQRVVDVVNEPISVEGGRLVRVRASAGVAVSGPDVETADDLLRHADIAMYRDKVAARSGAPAAVPL